MTLDDELLSARLAELTERLHERVEAPEVLATL